MNMYRKDCAVKLPFLRVDYVNAEALFSDDSDTFAMDSTIKGLYGEDFDESDVRLSILSFFHSIASFEMNALSPFYCSSRRIGSCG